MKKELEITTKHALSTLRRSEDLTVSESVFGFNITDKKKKKTLSVNLASDDKGTYSKDKGKYYYQKAGKNKDGASWNVIKVPKHKVRMYQSIKDFLQWYFD